MSKSLIFFAMILFSSKLVATDFSFYSKKSFNLTELRSIEIRYIKDYPVDQLFILVDDKKYPVFNTKEEAITYVENMSLKKDLTIVYVRSSSEKETEFTDIIE